VVTNLAVAEFARMRIGHPDHDLLDPLFLRKSAPGKSRQHHNVEISDTAVADFDTFRQSRFMSRSGKCPIEGGPFLLRKSSP
jgi:hypothetical protein